MPRLPVVIAAAVPLLLGCPGRDGGPAAVQAADPNTVEVVFSYGSEKQDWVTAATADFHATRPTLGDGKAVKVRPVPLGSGEAMAALNGRFDPADPAEAAAAKAHLTSPASAAFIELANADAAAAGQPPLIAAGTTRNLVLSPVVIAMWKPMAEALGWPQKAVGWGDVLDLAAADAGWAKVGKPQWGKLKFAHTHPLYSNSGLIAVLAETYAGANKKGDLTADDIKAEATREFVKKIENAVVFYGSSTGFFGKRMAQGGPALLSAAVLYENMVIEANKPGNTLEFPLVAVYPREGTFWSDHPVGVVDRDWVTAEHKEAAQLYVDFLMADAQQKKAQAFGFRPGKEAVPLDPAVFAAGNGVDPDEPKAILEVPPAAVVRAVLDMWQEVKKPVRLALVLDTSGSMTKDQRMVRAKAAAQQFVDLLGPRDKLTLLTFSSAPTWALEAPTAMDAAGKGKAKGILGDLFPRGETALYDAVAAAVDHLKADAGGSQLAAVVVLTDGEDNKSKLTADALIERIKFDPEGSATRVFTIAYGSDANTAVLKRIAEAAAAESATGDPATIQKVFRKVLQGL